MAHCGLSLSGSGRDAGPELPDLSRSAPKFRRGRSVKRRRKLGGPLIIIRFEVGDSAQRVGLDVVESVVRHPRVNLALLTDHPRWKAQWSPPGYVPALKVQRHGAFVLLDFGDYRAAARIVRRFPG